MVALAVRYCGQKPVICNSRPLLNQAFAAVERGDWIGAGVRLREAVRLYLAADCEYYGVEVSKRKARRTPRALLDALKRHGSCDEFCFERIGEVIAIGNSAAHMQFVQPSDIEDAISSMHFILDHSRYLVQPVAAGRLS